MLIGGEQRIVDVRGHYEAYDGKRFLCSGDTFEECFRELTQMITDEIRSSKMKLA